MYIPKHYAETDIAVLHALIGAHPLGAWVTVADGRLLANHIPFLVDRSRGQYGTLVGHVARANPVWQSFSSSTPSVVIFQGPEAYISPSWYPTKQEHGRVVPTWNYAVVHAHGVPSVIEDRQWLLRLVENLTREHEAGRAAPWKVSDAPADYIEKNLGAIVGIEIPISSLEGKWKASQNHPAASRRGVIEGLGETTDHRAREMAELMASQSDVPA
jgi:transcriptional regulator